MKEFLKNFAGNYELFSFLKNKAGFKFESVLIIGAVGGLANTMILVAIATSIYNLYAGEPNVRMFLIFLLLLALLVVAQRGLYHRWVKELELSVEKSRDDLCEKLTSADLKTIENLDRGEVFNRLTQELSNISQFGVYLIKGFQAVFIVLFVSFYMLEIFAPALLVITGMILIGAGIYLALIRKIYSSYDELNKTEIKYFNWISDVLYGRKEIKLNSKRKDDITSDGGIISDDLSSGRLKIGSLYNKSMVFTSAFFYFLFGSVVFIIPLLYGINQETLLVLTAITIYLADPISNIVSVIPLFQKVTLSVNYITHLEMMLDEAKQVEQAANDELKIINQIELKDVLYRYTIEENEFVLGPINLDIKRGEITFLTGGNGCGKTTLLKIIAAFYTPESGEVLVNDSFDLNKEIYLRESFAGIFSDFHLFEKPYGISEDTIPKLLELLKIFDLQDKVSITNNTFSTLNLSTGQKKRLALAVAMSENKEIYLLDEWAAEQDPEYREYFYTKLIQELKKDGKTVVVVSHDERYFDIADKLVKMDYGKIN